ncbi:MAG: GNAT family N-acetyltransferase [Tenericutes bacterium]|nr:GNAT family N-acetyltransferase [Mycoplasmatota bacterium]
MHRNLETERLTFRPFINEDLPIIIKLLTDDLVCKYLPGQGGYSLEVCSKYLKYFMMSFSDKNLNKIYLVSKKDNFAPIGYCGIQVVNEFEKYEIFYAYLPESWGHGFATEASLRMKELAIELGLKNIIALAHIDNISSQKVLLKTGYELQKQLPLWGLNLYYYELTL